MHLAHIGVHRAEIAREVGENVDRFAADLKEPRLGVMRIGGQNAGRDQSERRAAEARVIPEAPGRVGVALRQGRQGVRRTDARSGESDRHRAAEGERLAAAPGLAGHEGIPRLSAPRASCPRLPLMAAISIVPYRAIISSNAWALTAEFQGRQVLFASSAEPGYVRLAAGPDHTAPPTRQRHHDGFKRHK